MSEQETYYFSRNSMSYRKPKRGKQKETGKENINMEICVRTMKFRGTYMNIFIISLMKVRMSFLHND